MCVIIVRTRTHIHMNCYITFYRPRKYSVCMSNGDEVKAEREYIIDSMNHIQLKERANPLAMQIRKLVKNISKDVHNLTKNNTFVAVTICTHGVPTDGNGSSSRQVKREFLDSLRELGNLPVRIVFRLTTDEEKVIGEVAQLKFSKLLIIFCSQSQFYLQTMVTLLTLPI